jgi:hypothetical protein
MAPIGNDRTRAFANREECDRIRMKGLPFDDEDTYRLASCLALVYVMELWPYAGELETRAAFHPTRDTIVRLSPVIIVGPDVPSQFFDTISGEFIGDPFLHLENFESRFELESVVELRPALPGAHLTRWALRSKDSAGIDYSVLFLRGLGGGALAGKWRSGDGCAGAASLQTFGVGKPPRGDSLL